ncbi:MAG: formylglycine-generating enzyme family protein, partial [Leptolyngbyaceae cyanobacterium CAN_BIN12]|nr:formylglycine-generating enzyme family protein [Leptolyngbyaceae cyanobacterium CAN_BIN12]
MTVSSEPSYPIADLRALLSQRVGLDLSPIELAEIFWLALQKGEVVAEDSQSQRSPEPPAQKGIQEQLSRSSSEPVTEEPSSASSAAVVMEPPKRIEAGEEPPPTAGTALSVNIPEAVALRNRQEIARSLRPLMRKVPSKLRQAIDEEATVIQIAETQTWSPVVKPEPERWLELAIVIEVTNLLDVWRDTIAEFQQLMERHGAFRNVRTWQLKPNAAGDPQLFLQTAAGLRGSARSPRELLDAGGRRLILLLSDCTSRAWRSGKIPKLLELWSRENPVTIVQLLPEHYWDRSALKASYSVALRSRRPGALSRDWAIDGLSPRRRQQLP